MSTYAQPPRTRHLRSIRRVLLVGALAAAGAGIAADQASAAYSAQVSGDVLTLTGNGASDRLALRLQAGVPTTLQVDVGNDGTAEAAVNRSRFDRIVVNAGGGDDLWIDDANGTFTDTEATTINGGSGGDTLLGGGGAETFTGGPGRDAIDGNRGADVAFMGSGEDTFTWDPGDGSDVVEGQSGTDTLDFNGAAGAETFDLAADGSRLRFFRNVGNITMDMDGVERVDLDSPRGRGHRGPRTTCPAPTPGSSWYPPTSGAPMAPATRRPTRSWSTRPPDPTASGSSRSSAPSSSGASRPG